MKTLSANPGERGSAIVEFLICAPILALLTYAAYDWNRRIENQQTVTIAARNTVMLGGAFSSSQLNANVKKQLDVEGQILDDAERNQVLSSVFIDVVANGKLGNDEYSRMKGATGFNTGGQGQSSSFDSMSSATGTLAEKGGKLVQTLQGAGEKIHIFIPDGIRSAGVETRADGSSNALQSAISVIAKYSSREDGAQKDALAVERRFGQRVFMRQESGYHPNGHNAVDGAAVVVGVGMTAWGGGSDFGDDKDEIQARCMTRLYGSNACGSGGSHDFHSKVRNIADFKWILSTVFTALENFPPTSGIGIAANGAAQGVTIIPACLAYGTIAGAGLLNSVMSALDKGKGDFLKDVTPKLENTDVVTSFSSDLSPDLFEKKAGG